MPDVYDLAQQFRADLIARDDAARRRLVAAYFNAYKRLAAELAILTNQIEEARLRGEVFSPSWLYRQERYQSLIRQLVAEITALSRDAASLIESRQAEEVGRALRDSGTLMTAAAASGGISATFTQLPTAALEYLVGTLADGSPLMDLLATLPETARDDVRRALVAGLAEGAGPRIMAQRMRQALGGNLTRALTIARTESLRAYRSATLANFRANEDLVSGWIWTASASRRTCLACLALDGKFFPLTQPMRQHPNCRCSLRPALKGLPPLDGPRARQWFDQQPEAIQVEMMGKKAQAEYQAGRVTLDDFIGEARSARWGNSYYQRSLVKIDAGIDAPAFNP